MACPRVSTRETRAVVAAHRDFGPSVVVNVVANERRRGDAALRRQREVVQLPAGLAVNPSTPKCGEPTTTSRLPSPFKSPSTGEKLNRNGLSKVINQPLATSVTTKVDSCSTG